jgi:nucleotide-binding universal stress UspA family protein
MRVLVAYDGSDSAAQACDLVRGLDWPSRSEVVVVNAFQPYVPGALFPGEIGDPVTVESISAAERAAAERVARQGAGRAAWPRAKVTIETLEGRPASAILEVAARHTPDLLVVGSRGRGPFQSALLGSVSAELVDHAPCSVLVARRSAVGRVIVADDGSPTARAAVSLVADWPIFRRSQVRVVSVATGPPGARAAPDGTIVDSGIEAAMAVAIEAVGTLWEAGIAADLDARRDDAAHGIVRSALDWRAELIVMGSRGRGGVQRLLLGSVARNVLQHAACSVLVARATGQDGEAGTRAALMFGGTG